MTHVEDELTSQPECWTRAAAEAAGYADALPAAGERVAIVGCGTSYFMAQAVAALREEARARARPTPSPPRSSRTAAATTGSSPSPAPAPPPRSSTCWRAVEAGAPARPRSPPTPPPPSWPPPTSSSSSTSPTNAPSSRPGSPPPPSPCSAPTWACTPTPSSPTPAPRWRLRCPKGSSSARSSPSSAAAGRVGLANEAGLKMREASLAWTEAYPAMEYRHGPISVTTHGTATWMLGEAPEGLAEQVPGHRRTVGGRAASTRSPNWSACSASRSPSPAARGLDPDQPRHLTRSVILARRRRRRPMTPRSPPASSSPGPPPPAPPSPPSTSSPWSTSRPSSPAPRPLDAPVVLQVSENAVKFRYGQLLPLARAAVAAPNAPPYPSRCTSTTSRATTCCARRPTPASAP